MAGQPQQPTKRLTAVAGLLSQSVVVATGVVVAVVLAVVVVVMVKG